MGGRREFLKTFLIINCPVRWFIIVPFLNSMALIDSEKWFYLSPIFITNINVSMLPTNDNANATGQWHSQVEVRGASQHFSITVIFVLFILKIFFLIFCDFLKSQIKLLFEKSGEMFSLASLSLRHFSWLLYCIFFP